MNVLKFPTPKPCSICEGRGWMQLMASPSRHIVAPCVQCSSDRDLVDIINERQVKIVKCDNGSWMEIPLVPKCGACGDAGSVYLAYIDPNVSHQRARDLVPCPKCEFWK